MSYKIDNDNPLPRYFQVYNSLLERIQSGEFGADKPLPPERSLTTEYGVSRITIVKAMDKLKHEGVVDRQHGRGTFVRSTKLVNDAVEPLSISGQLQRMGLEPDWRLLDRGFFPAPPAVAKWFQLGSDSLHFQVTIQLLANDKPLGYHHIGVRRDLAIAARAEYLDDMALRQWVRALPEQQHCQCQRGFEAIPASEEVARWLDVAVGTPVLMVDLLYTDPQGQVVQFIRSYFRGDRFRYNL